MKRKMLSNKHKESIIANIEGYEVETTESYQSALNCVICSLIIKKATNGCECHVFCKSFLENYISETSFYLILLLT